MVKTPQKTLNRNCATKGGTYQVSSELRIKDLEHLIQPNHSILTPVRARKLVKSKIWQMRRCHWSRVSMTQSLINASEELDKDEEDDMK